MPATPLAGCAAWFAIGIALSIAPASASEDAGRCQFMVSCGTCHTAEAGALHRQGPNLHGNFGRKSGQVANFKRSDAFANPNLVWDEPTLEKRIEDSGVMLPGTNMAYRQRDPEKRRLAIPYLESLKPQVWRLKWQKPFTA